MDKVIIRNEENTVQAVVAPDYGGMIIRLLIKGRDILFLDENRLSLSPVLAGGIPILFPFSGRTTDDSYIVGGKRYYMPMHGIVKNRSFAVREKDDNSVTLWVREDAASLERNYPYRYELELTYQIAGMALYLKARVKNDSEKEMPHYLGWHPYFKCTDLQKIRLRHSMRIHYDYINRKECRDFRLNDLSQNLDDVFHSPEENEFTLTNRKEGYEVRCDMDVPFQALIVYNGTPGSICVEPWCGIPDSIHDGRMLEQIPAGTEKEYIVKMELKNIY